VQPWNDRLKWIFRIESKFRLIISPPAKTGGLAFQASKSACKINDEANQQNQAKAAAADDRAAQIKPAAAEQEKQDHHE